MFNFISKEAGTPTDDGGGSGFSKIVFAKSNLVETLKKVTLEDVFNMKEKSSKFLDPDLRQKEEAMKQIADAQVIIIPFYANAYIMDTTPGQ